MHQIISRFSVKCVHVGIVEEDMLEWFCYALEKRVVTTISALILLVPAISFSNIWTAVAYLGSFFYLRSRTSGYHANSFVGCLFISVILEATFLLFVLPILTIYMALILNLVSLVIVYLLAPYNHPNMHMTDQEIEGCRISARLRITMLSAMAILLYFCALKNISNGFTLGNTMTALLLLIKNK